MRRAIPSRSAAKASRGTMRRGSEPARGLACVRVQRTLSRKRPVALALEKVHPVALLETLTQSREEFRRGQRHAHAPSQVVRHHAVEEPVVRALKHLLTVRG